MRCLRGSIYDVIVDVRNGSPTLGKWVAAELTEANKRMLWVPKGYAHGFVVTSDSADVLYKVTDYWSKEHERGLRWNDPAVRITWPDVGITTQVDAVITGWRPQVVIHCAAHTKVDACETEVERAYALNAIGSANVAIACHRTGARLIAISTDYVFAGDLNRP